MSGYTGRFAPSPTGPLHAGSLVSALASWVDARYHKGQWLLRIEDIDPPREVAGASTEIIDCLSAHGLHWDAEIVFQSTRAQHYELALQTLRNKNALYACECTRKHLRALAADGSHAYPGYCRDKGLDEQNAALRVKIHEQEICFNDIAAGNCCDNVARTLGDFIVRRRGPWYAYQLAVVVDDALQGVTHVVRGADLLDNTARQIALQQLLSYPTPAYLHLPIVESGDGRKLSKQTGAQPLDNHNALGNLQQAWEFLGQQPLPECVSVAGFLEKAVSQWKRNRIPDRQNSRLDNESAT